MNEKDILELMTDLGALRKGHFLLSSGRHSDTYFQCAKVLMYPDLAAELGASIADRFQDSDVDLVVAPALGAILLGHEVARAMGRRFVFSERVDGVMAIRRGFEIQKGEKVLIVEDVVTRGTSTREVADLVTAAGGVVVGLTSLVDRTDETVELPGELKSLARVKVESWTTEDCPLCADGSKAEKPGSRSTI
jgi:orotate phosphoribosyltransferase